MTQIIDFSADGGQTWIRVANFSETDDPDILQAYDGVDTYIIMCGTTGAGNDGIFRSTDNGVSFSRVTGITGLNFPGDSWYKAEYGLGKLWVAGSIDFEDGGKMFSSSDDGSSWTEEVDPVGQEILTFAISGSGIMWGTVDSANTSGNFDADGVSLTNTMISNFFGQGANYTAFGNGVQGARGNWLWADPNSVKPNRFFALMYDAAADLARIIYSDDNGTTWVRVKLGLSTFGIPMTTADGCHFMWDGTNYHCLLGGSTNSWFWSRDGSIWTEAPVSMANSPAFLNWVGNIPGEAVATATKSP